jgi:hypothetical protein
MNTFVSYLVLNTTGNAGAVALLQALCYNRTVWKLDMSGNHLSDAVCPVLSHVLIENDVIKVRLISECKIGRTADVGSIIYAY